MLGVDPNVICHHLNMDPQHKHVIQKKRRLVVQHMDAMRGLHQMTLLEPRAIREVYYPEWLSHTIVVKKNGKWRVCVDFTDLSKACPRDSFPLPRIDQLVYATVGYKRMSFLNTYRGYHMFSPDQDKTSFITPWELYCYVVKPFGLRNAGATYQRLATIMFTKDHGCIYRWHGGEE